MKALSLWQPWASAIALGSKTIETRHWPTHYRGPIAIHAAKRKVKGELLIAKKQSHWQAALNYASPLDLPFGAVVAVAQLVDCRPTESFTDDELFTLRDSGGMAQWCEEDMGDFSPGRFGWVLGDVQALPEPVPFVGRQGLFNLPVGLIG